MNFKPIKPEDYRILFPYFKNQTHELCEYCLTTMIVWANDDYQPHYAIENETVYIWSSFSNTKELNHLALPISNSREFSPWELYELALRLNQKAYWFIPASYIDRYSASEVTRYFTMHEQKAYEDYVYKTKIIASLKGNRYSKKRNLINQFLRDYNDPNRIIFEDITAANADACLNFIEEWCSTRNCDEDLNDSLTCERLAAEKYLQNVDYFNSKGLLLKLDGKVSAFAVSSYLTNNMGVLQFEKAFEDIKGLYQYFDKECMNRLLDGYEFVNKESDMEVPGLEKSKKSYYPHKRVKSYQLICKN